MAELKVRLFGKFSMEQGEQNVAGIQARKVQELFSYLLISRHRPQPREVLCEILWADQPPAKAKKNLRQALWRLQSALENIAVSRKPEIVADDDWVQISPSASFWLDTAELEQSFNKFNDTDPHDLTLKDFETLQVMLSLYRGDLLEGWYHNWCLFERERFQIMHLTLLDKLIQYCELHAHCALGLAYGTDVLRHDYAYERTHRQMMRLYCMAGDRTQALHQYERCVTALRNELDIEPSEATKQLYEEIRSDTFRSSLGSEGNVSGEAVEPVQALSGMLNRLDHFSEELSRIRFRIEKEITALRNTLSPE